MTKGWSEVCGCVLAWVGLHKYLGMAERGWGRRHRRAGWRDQGGRVKFAAGFERGRKGFAKVGYELETWL